MCKKLISGRRSGKTAEMILNAVKNNGVIITHREDALMFIKSLAKEMGLDSPAVYLAQQKPKQVHEHISLHTPAVKMCGEKPITYKEVMDALERFKKVDVPNRYYYFTLPVANLVRDEDAIEYFKSSGVVVVDREGNRWLYGKHVEGEW